jgi:hypothetical protein
MRRVISVFAAVLWATFLVAGCGGGGSQTEKEQHAHEESHGESHSAKLAMSPEGDTGVSGTAAFENASKGVRVELELHDLPEPHTLYLAHIHPGTCAQGEGEGEAHEHGEHHEEEGQAHEHGESSEHAEEADGHAHGREIEYPLSQVESNSEGRGSSTTTLRETSVQELFSGEPKHVNVHEAGSGDPPILSGVEKRPGSQLR